MRTKCAGECTMKTNFYSSFAGQLEEFVTHKKALGYSYTSSIIQLKQFDHFCKEQFPEESFLSKEIVHSWLQSRSEDSLGTRKIRLGCLRQFALFLHNLGYNAYVAPKELLPSYKAYIPYVFSDEELTHFFTQIDSCSYWGGYPYRHLRLPVLFRLLYCCGLRLSEATHLRVRDFDLTQNVLIVRHGKFDKERRVPLLEDMASRCKHYAANLPMCSDGSAYYFSASKGINPLSSATVYSNFREFLWKANISHGGKGKGPRVHDFRHTFAVHRLRSWVREGKDLSAYLPLLKIYLGHSHFRETAYYLRLTADLYPDITEKVERLFSDLIPQIKGEI